MFVWKLGFGERLYIGEKKLPWKTHKFHLCLYISPKLEIIPCFSGVAHSAQRGTLKDTVLTKYS